MARPTGPSAVPTRIVLRIDGVTAKTPVGALTVAQLVEILVQVAAQSRPTPEEVLQRFRSEFPPRQAARRAGLSRAVRRVHDALLEELPALATPRAAKSPRRRRSGS